MMGKRKQNFMMSCPSTDGLGRNRLVRHQPAFLLILHGLDMIILEAGSSVLQFVLLAMFRTVPNITCMYADVMGQTIANIYIKSYIVIISKPNKPLSSAGDQFFVASEFSDLTTAVGDGVDIPDVKDVSTGTTVQSLNEGVNY